MAEAEISTFLSHLAVNRKVTASTQKQALGAILFLYKDVLKKPLDWIQMFNARSAPRLPVVFTREEVQSILRNLDRTRSIPRYRRRRFQSTEVATRSHVASQHTPCL